MTGGFDGMQLRASAKEIAAQLRYTRAQAIATGRAAALHHRSARAHTWTAPNDRTRRDPEAARHRLHRRARSAAAPRQGAILFFPDGASTGGRVQLSVEEAAWNIDVAWLTGEVQVAPRRGEPP